MDGVTTKTREAEAVAGGKGEIRQFNFSGGFK